MFDWKLRQISYFNNFKLLNAILISVMYEKGPQLFHTNFIYIRIHNKIAADYLIGNYVNFILSPNEIKFTKL